jgi:hypothetical protein
LIEIPKAFASYVSLPKEGVTGYVVHGKLVSIVRKVVKQVAVVSHEEAKPYVGDPPFPTGMKENLLTSIVYKSS